MNEFTEPIYFENFSQDSRQCSHETKPWQKILELTKLTLIISAITILKCHKNYIMQHTYSNPLGELSMLIAGPRSVTHWLLLFSRVYLLAGIVYSVVSWCIDHFQRSSLCFIMYFRLKYGSKNTKRLFTQCTSCNQIYRNENKIHLKYIIYSHGHSYTSIYALELGLFLFQ